jgi:hypothetical protein
MRQIPSQYAIASTLKERVVRHADLDERVSKEFLEISLIKGVEMKHFQVGVRNESLSML